MDKEALRDNLTKLCMVLYYILRVGLKVLEFSKWPSFKEIEGGPGSQKLWDRI